MIGWVLVIAASSLQAQDLVGRHTPPYPDGLALIHASCMSDSPQLGLACGHSVAVLGAPAAAGATPVARFVIASRRAGMSGDSLRWEIVDALPYPAAGPGRYFQSGSCRLDGVADAQVVAVVNDADPARDRVTDIAWAARLDLPEARFTVLDAARVDCENEAYGL